MSAVSSIFKKGNTLPLILIGAGLLLSFAKPLSAIISPAKLDIQITPAPAIMPSIYKVYANNEALNGKYSLFKMVVTNNSSRAAENVEVKYSVSNYIENATAEKIPKILPGQTVVVNCYPSFPEKIIEKTTASKENVTITIKGSNIKTVEKDFAVQVKGRNEFVYSFIPAEDIRTAAESFDNKDLLSCLVTPEDPIIKYLTQKIQEKILKGEAASVENTDKENVRFMMGIYEATRRCHMVYSGTSGVPEKIGDANTITQSIRLPREVITGKTGLCIELSLLYSSVMMCAGMNPVVYLVPGHAYPGFRVGGNYYAIEATGINGEGLGGVASAEQALQIGSKNLDEFIKHAQMGDPAYTILDVREAIKQGALAMELKDDSYLRTKIDEIAQSFDGGYIANDVNANGANGNGGGGGNEGGGGGNDGGGNTGGGNAGGGGNGLPAGYNYYQGVVSFGYPASWRLQPRTQYTMKQCTHVLANGSRNTYLEVYNFQGYSSAQQAMTAIQQYVGNMGASLRYQNAGQSGAYTYFSGTTVAGNTGLNWIAAFKSTGNGVAGIAVGAYSNVNASGTAQKIISTLQ